MGCGEHGGGGGLLRDAVLRGRHWGLGTGDWGLGGRQLACDAGGEGDDGAFGGAAWGFVDVGEGDVASQRVGEGAGAGEA